MPQPLLSLQLLLRLVLLVPFFERIPNRILFIDRIVELGHCPVGEERWSTVRVKVDHDVVVTDMKPAPRADADDCVSGVDTGHTFPISAESTVKNQPVFEPIR